MKPERATEPSLRFTPSHVEGLTDVTEIVFYPERMEVHAGGQWKTFQFAELARWPRPAWLWKILFRFGRRRDFLPVADRDWFHPNEGKFFDFYTQPRLKVYMPVDSPEDYHASHFRKIQDVLLAGGFHSFDLG